MVLEMYSQMVLGQRNVEPEDRVPGNVYCWKYCVTFTMLIVGHVVCPMLISHVTTNAKANL